MAYRCVFTYLVLLFALLLNGAVSAQTVIGPVKLTADWSVRGTQGGGFGRAAAGAGDVNGDGYDDVIVGSDLFTDSLNDRGIVYMYLGTPTGLEEVPAWEALGTKAHHHFGRGVRTAGDVNGDGYDDVMVGSPTNSNDSADGTISTAHLFHGSPDGPSLAPDWEIVSPQFGDRLGRMVGRAGDINNDGFDDVLVGAYFHDVGVMNNGGVIVYFGSAFGLAPHHDWVGFIDSEGAGLGWAAATAGDVNGDGFDDIIAGAPHLNTQRGGEFTNDGGAFVWHGSATGLPDAPDWSATIPDAGSNFGRGATSAGDVNGDGFDDVIVGARFADAPGGNKFGAAAIYLGSADGLSREPSWITNGEHNHSQFGVYVAGAGDVNGDGFDDVLVAAPTTERGEYLEGAVYLYLGSAHDGPSVDADFVAEGDAENARMGYSVWTAGDVDGDSLDDFVVGFREGETTTGRTDVFLGKTVTASLASQGPAVQISVVPDELAAAPGSEMVMSWTVRNLSATDAALTAWIDLVWPDQTTTRVANVGELSLKSFETKTKVNRVSIPRGTPSGRYRFVLRMGSSDGDTRFQRAVTVLVNL